MKLILLGIALLQIACQPSNNFDTNEQVLPVSSQDSPWAEYWYAGTAELNVFEVEQARYNEVHPGQTVLVFVTEDFLTDKQVKNESAPKKQSTSVLKTNLIRNFTTGIYDYSMMTSVFTPVNVRDHARTLKVTMSSQDWCGQSWMQLNLRRNKYSVQQFSYFEQEGDQKYEVTAVLLEDEIFNRIRINPDQLPTGDIELLPSTAFSRLKHLDYKPYPSKISKMSYSGQDFSGTDLKVYRIEMPSLDRNLEIIYEAAFPHRIEGWSDTYPVFGGKSLTSTSKRVKTTKSPYWSKHDLEHKPLRAELGL